MKLSCNFLKPAPIYQLHQSHTQDLDLQRTSNFLKAMEFGVGVFSALPQRQTKVTPNLTINATPTSYIPMAIPLQIGIMAERMMRSRCRGEGQGRMSRGGSFRRKDSSGRRRCGSRNYSRGHGDGVALRRTVSEPILWDWDSEPCIQCPVKKREKEKGLMRPHTLSALFDRSYTSPCLPPRTPPRKSEKPECDKILVNVTVEGSSGPIRLIVKRGDTVSDLIKLTINNYAKEGRHPLLDSNTDIFELHLSNFSMESLKRSDRVGELGSRTFFLRQENGRDSEPVLFTPTTGPLFFSVIMRRMKKIGRRTRKFWNIVDCMACG